MEQLIEALQIFLKYKNENYPTHCEHDTLYIMGVEKDDVSPEDVNRLEELGFFWSEEDDGVFMSFKYGSA
jgi:hypothetical protein